MLQGGQRCREAEEGADSRAHACTASSGGIKRIDPAESREAREVGVARVQLGSVLDGDGRQMRVADEIAGGSQRPQQLPQKCGVPGAGLEDDGARSAEPAIDDVEGLLSRQRALEDTWTRAQTKKCQEHGPRERERVGPLLEALSRVEPKF